jgi:hypothetical protein
MTACFWLLLLWVNHNVVSKAATPHGEPGQAHGGFTMVIAGQQRCWHVHAFASDASTVLPAP